VVAFNRPIPDNMRGDTSGGRKQPSGLSLYVQAEKMLQIAFVLPCALVIGWGLGAWADHALHQKWMTIGGVILGSVSGLVFVIRMAFNAEKSSPADSGGSTGENAAGLGDKKDSESQGG
jgi:F0F1-type ATP synthase assembly protein I